MSAFRILLLALAVHLVGGLSLPISLWLEFRDGDPERYSSFWFLLRHYPHIIVYGGGFSLVATTALFCCFARLKPLVGAKRVWFAAGAALLLGGGYAAIDFNGDNMMLLEFSVQGQKADDRFQQVLAAINSNDPLQDFADNERLFSPRAAKEGALFSNSRPFYFLSLLYNCSLVALSFLFGALALGLNTTRRDGRAIVCLLAAMTALSIWFLFRVYFNLVVKSKVFGMDSIHPISPDHFPGFGYFELAALLLLSLLAAALAWTYSAQADTLYKWLARIGSILPAGFSVIGVVAGFADHIVANSQILGVWILVAILIAVAIPLFIFGDAEEDSNAPVSPSSLPAGDPGEPPSRTPAKKASAPRKRAKPSAKKSAGRRSRGGS